MRRLISAFQLTPGERKIVWFTFCNLPIVELLLRRSSWSRAHETMLRRTQRFAVTFAPDVVAPDRAAEIVIQVCRMAPWKVTCMRQSLVLEAVLLAVGSKPELKVGAYREQEGIKFHAWVELFGEPIGESRESLSHMGVFDVKRPD